MSVTPGGLLPGWYCAVFGVSLAHLEDIEDRLDNIIFDVTSTEMNTRVIRTQVTVASLVAAAQRVSTGLEFDSKSADFALLSNAVFCDFVML